METSKINTGVNLHSASDTQVIEAVFNRLSAQLVNIAEAWEATDNINDLDQNITAFTDMAAVEVEKEVGGFEYDTYIELMGELGRYAGVWVNLYLNRTNWSNRPEWLANSVRNAMNNGANATETMNANKTVALCPLDFDTTFDAYNYAMAHRLDEKPLAVAIPTDAHGTTFLMSLAANGVKLFGLWSDELDSTANGYVYTTEAGAREALRQVEANDMEAGVYEPDFYKVVDMTKYFAA